MTIEKEEIFGPVLCIMPFDGEADAVRVANNSPYGLTNYVPPPPPPLPMASPTSCAAYCVVCICFVGVV
jgi:hypothetical protein